jgi:hypothetical protein
VSHKKVAVGLSSKQRTGTTCRIWLGNCRADNRQPLHTGSASLHSHFQNFHQTSVRENWRQRRKERWNSSSPPNDMAESVYRGRRRWGSRGAAAGDGESPAAAVLGQNPSCGFRRRLALRERTGSKEAGAQPGAGRATGGGHGAAAEHSEGRRRSGRSRATRYSQASDVKTGLTA